MDGASDDEASVDEAREGITSDEIASIIEEIVEISASSTSVAEPEPQNNSPFDKDTFKGTL